MNVRVQIRIHVFLDTFADLSFSSLTDSADWLFERSSMTMVGTAKALARGCKNSRSRSVGRSPVQVWKIFWSQPAKSAVFAALRPSLGKVAKLDAEGDAAERIGVHGRANWFQYLDRAVKFLEDLTAQSLRG